MLAAEWNLFSLLATIIVFPLAQALTPLALPLPQNFELKQYISEQLLRYSFSTDPQSTVATAGTAPTLQLFLSTKQTCVSPGADIVYQIIVRNVGDEPAVNVTLELQYPPTLTLSRAQPAALTTTIDSVPLAEWHIDTLTTGAELTNEATFMPNAPALPITLNSVVFASSAQGIVAQTLTKHTIADECTGQVAAAQSKQNRQPAIVCDPAEIGCVDTRFLLNLGPNFRAALNNPKKGPADCNEQGCTTFPELGKRFNDAVATIVPGECSVLADSVLHPDYAGSVIAGPPGPPVETTFCESGVYPEALTPAGEPIAKKGQVVPPPPINGGEQTGIIAQEVVGQVCGGGPGDPYWTLSCACHCGQFVACGGTLVLCENLASCTGNPNDQLLRHDNRVTSQRECLSDPGHKDPFF